MKQPYRRAIDFTRAGVFALAIAGCANLSPEPQAALASRQSVVFFPANSAELTPGAKQVVQRVADTAMQVAPAKIIVEGHADGGTARDATLANERARSVLQALQMAGVDPGKIEMTHGAPAPTAKGIEARKAVVRFER